MKTILIWSLTIAIIVMAYFLFFSKSSDEVTRIAESREKSINAKTVSNAGKISDYDQLSSKLSMKQIDSITALENYNFTVQNYNKDVIPAQTAELKNKKL